MTNWPVHARITGPIVMIGFGSIGKGTLPLIERHFDYDKSRFVVIDPEDKDRNLLDERGIRFIHQAVTTRQLPRAADAAADRRRRPGLLRQPVGRHLLARHHGALPRDRRALHRHRRRAVARLLFRLASSGRRRAPTTRCARRCSRRGARKPGGTTAVSCCGANPGMVSWFVKQALLNLAGDLGLKFKEPKTPRGLGAARRRRLGVKGIHIAERDTQRAKQPKPLDVFVNTWSVEGFLSEGMQPAELGWGTHEKWMPTNGHTHKTGCQAAIYLMQPGANTRVRSWTPTAQAQYGFLVTHNESISIADYFTLREGRQGDLPADLPLRLSPVQRRGAVAARDVRPGRQASRTTSTSSTRTRSSTASTNSACCSTATRRTPTGTARSSRSRRRATLAPYQNATGLQVTSAVLAGMVWALENPKAGIVEADEMDFRRCLEVQLPYLGPVIGAYTDWTPLDGRPGLFPEDIDKRDPWQFKNVLVR